MDYQEALNFALNGQAIIFTGAGFSAGTTSLDDLAPPQGEELAHILGAQSCSKLVNDLKDASDVAIPKLTADIAVPLLHELFRLKKVTEAHLSIASVPWLKVYTTNYDDAFEFAYSSVGKPYTSITPSSPTDQPRNINIIFHINGFINTLDKRTLLTEFKLTNRSYQTIEFLDSPWSNILVTDIQKASACFFVGYSLYDIDIQRILTRVNNIREKCFFLFKDYPDEILEARVSGFGEILTGGYEKFAADITEAKNVFVLVNPKLKFSCFKYESKESYTNIFSDMPDVFDLLVFGKINKGKFFQSVANNFDGYYCLQRSYVKKIIGSIEKNIKNIIIDSDIGNGKSIIIEILKAYFVHSNIRCYTLINDGDSIDAEIGEIYKYEGKQVIFIDGIHRHKAILKKSSYQRPENTFFIMSERTALAEVNGKLLEDIFADNLYSVSVNRINDDDLKRLISLLKSHGLLGEFANYQEERCFCEFKDNNLTSFLNIILYLYDTSDHIKEKISQVLHDIQTKSGYFSLLAGIFVASFLRTELTLNEILEITKITGNKSIIFQSDSSVRQLIDSDYNTISAKSSILAQYILKNKMLAKDVVPILTNIYEYCTKNKSKSKIYYDIIDELNRFSTIQRILSKDNLLDECISYFESIKKYNLNERNPSFWLQYAISHTVNNSYERAQEYFKTARATLRKDQRGTKLYIDNYYARFLLQRCIFNSKFYNFDDFKTVKNIVNSQIIDKETMYYPYRIIMNYKNFYNIFGVLMSKSQKEFILNHCLHIISRTKIPMGVDRNYYRINEAIDDLHSLVSKIQLELGNSL
jgi:hypothetical protein